jgi:tetratricopeptide (TPR) repeat protein
MNYLGNWMEYILAKERLYSLLALAAIIAIGFGEFLFIKSSIIPQLKVRSELIPRLASAEKELMEVKRAQEEAPKRLKEKVATAEAKLKEVADFFLSESQATEALSGLYQYAIESGVEIVELQTQPRPEEKRRAYEVRRFRLKVEGTLPNLLKFMSRIKGAALTSYIITNVNITEVDELHSLAMDVTLYVSPYSSGAAVQETPSAPPSKTSEILRRLDEELAIAWAFEEWERAIDIINRILFIDPYYDEMVEKLYEAYVNYGYQLLEEGDIERAMAQFRIALKIKPGGEEAMEGLREAATTPEEKLAQRLHEPWAAENWEEVIRLIEQILEINPDYDDMTEKLYAAHVNYGYKLASEGKLEEAKEEFIRALAIKPDGEEAMEGLRELAGEALTPPTTQYTIHLVRRGDTLYSIARRYGTTVQAIMEANGLTSYYIYVGQRLYIPIR